MTVDRDKTIDRDRFVCRAVLGDPSDPDNAPWSGLRVYAPRAADHACAGCTSRAPVVVDIEASIGSQHMPLVGFGLCADCVARVAIEMLTKAGLKEELAISIRKAIRALPPEHQQKLLGTGA